LLILTLLILLLLLLGLLLLPMLPMELLFQWFSPIFSPALRLRLLLVTSWILGLVLLLLLASWGRTRGRICGASRCIPCQHLDTCWYLPA